MYSGLMSTVSGKHVSIYSGLTAKMCLLISGKDKDTDKLQLLQLQLLQMTISLIGQKNENTFYIIYII